MKVVIWFIKLNIFCEIAVLGSDNNKKSLIRQGENTILKEVESHKVLKWGKPTEVYIEIFEGKFLLITSNAIKLICFCVRSNCFT